MLFAARKLLTAFLLPPGIFVILLVFASLIFARQRRHLTAMLTLLLAAALWGVSVRPVSLQLLGRLESGYRIPAGVDGDVIVLLGGGVVAAAEDLTGTGIPACETLMRTVTAVRLQKRLMVPVIVSGGAVHPSRPAEAPIIGRMITDLGVPAESVILEEKSRDTEENARFTAALLRRHGFSRPILVTSAYHLRRAVNMFERAGVKVTPFPAYAYPTVPITVWSDWLPDAAAMNRSTAALREYLGLLWWRSPPRR